MPKGDIVGKLVLMDVTLEEALNQVHKPVEVMGLLERVSKVVPLWHISNNGLHKKTL
jgi:hypothetical protein